MRSFITLIVSFVLAMVTTGAINANGQVVVQSEAQAKSLREVVEQKDLPTHVYLENVLPALVEGRTALGGKLTYVGPAVGYGISANTLARAKDQDGLPSSVPSEGLWIMMRDVRSGKLMPQYFGTRVIILTFQHEPDSRIK